MLASKLAVADVVVAVSVSSLYPGYAKNFTLSFLKSKETASTLSVLASIATKLPLLIVNLGLDIPLSLFTFTAFSCVASVKSSTPRAVATAPYASDASPQSNSFPPLLPTS